MNGHIHKADSPLGTAGLEGSFVPPKDGNPFDYVRILMWGAGSASLKKETMDQLSNSVTKAAEQDPKLVVSILKMAIEHSVNAVEAKNMIIRVPALQFCIELFSARLSVLAREEDLTSWMPVDVFLLLLESDSLEKGYQAETFVIHTLSRYQLEQPTHFTAPHHLSPPSTPLSAPPIATTPRRTDNVSMDSPGGAVYGNNHHHQSMYSNQSPSASPSLRLSSSAMSMSMSESLTSPSPMDRRRSKKKSKKDDLTVSPMAIAMAGPMTGHNISPLDSSSSNPSPSSAASFPSQQAVMQATSHMTGHNGTPSSSFPMSSMNNYPSPSSSSQTAAVQGQMTGHVTGHNSFPSTPSPQKSGTFFPMTSSSSPSSEQQLSSLQTTGHFSSSASAGMTPRSLSNSCEFPSASSSSSQNNAPSYQQMRTVAQPAHTYNTVGQSNCTSSSYVAQHQRQHSQPVTTLGMTQSVAHSPANYQQQGHMAVPCYVAGGQWQQGPPQFQVITQRQQSSPSNGLSRPTVMTNGGGNGNFNGGSFQHQQLQLHQQYSGAPALVETSDQSRSSHVANSNNSLQLQLQLLQQQQSENNDRTPSQMANASGAYYSNPPVAYQTSVGPKWFNMERPTHSGTILGSTNVEMSSQQMISLGGKRIMDVTSSRSAAYVGSGGGVIAIDNAPLVSLKENRPVPKRSRSSGKVDGSFVEGDGFAATRSVSSEKSDVSGSYVNSQQQQQQATRYAPANHMVDWQQLLATPGTSAFNNENLNYMMEEGKSQSGGSESTMMMTNVSSRGLQQSHPIGQFSDKQLMQSLNDQSQFSSNQQLAAASYSSGSGSGGIDSNGMASAAAFGSSLLSSSASSANYAMASNVNNFSQPQMQNWFGFSDPDFTVPTDVSDVLLVAPEWGLCQDEFLGAMLSPSVPSFHSLQTNRPSSGAIMEL
eukprot:CAMPEP_0184673496 /NCGR_PEP_ID=MMETSP0308-20130426/86714_1 /TAXON_ID=38269 /ORGANISM="Gloeochaete witrockiana, Strain SAG 46.84" /LENGTH=927 /DNA_ID=CAMNT_0027120993 /DNA_START=368 /DNA_END=3151 /DNA_ORIENTATION=+